MNFSFTSFDVSFCDKFFAYKLSLIWAIWNVNVCGTRSFCKVFYSFEHDIEILT